MLAQDLAGAYFRFSFGRAAFARGWWLATSLYLVVVADLTPFQLVFLGTAQGMIAVVAEVPAGVLADTVSRKWSIVAAQVLSGAGMVATGLVTEFPALVATQMLWGLGWTFSSGADVAWLSDELDDSGRVSRVLTASARWEGIGGFAGTIAFGALAWATSLELAILGGGAMMLALGGYVALRFPEQRFVRTREKRWQASLAIFHRGVSLARHDRQIMAVLLATVLIHGAAEGGRLYPRHLVDLGFPGSVDPIAWLTALGLATLALGALVLRVVESHIDGAGVARRVYVLASLAGTAGLVVFAAAPDAITGMAGLLLVGGIAMSVTRAVGVIWVNRRVTSNVRATVQSFLAQAEYSGEIVLGFGLALLAGAAGIEFAILASGALFAIAAILVLRITVSRASAKSTTGV
jgi:hypothetical protein